MNHISIKLGAIRKEKQNKDGRWRVCFRRGGIGLIPNSVLIKMTIIFLKRCSARRWASSFFKKDYFFCPFFKILSHYRFEYLY